MNQPSENITKFLIIFVFCVFVIKTFGGSGIFVSKFHKGKGYMVTIPEGWKKLKKEKGVVYPNDVEIATFVPKTMDVNALEPDVLISIYTKRLGTPVWIQDEFPEILKALSDSGFKIMDKGEIKLDEEISEWVVYHDQKAPALILEFYMVTDNSTFYKIQYFAHPDKFNVFRSDFEALKDSFVFRFSMY